MTAAADPIAVAVRVGEILDALGVRHTIGGSIAASFAGEPRSTIDVDFVAALSDRHVAPLMVAAKGRRDVGPAMARRNRDRPDSGQRLDRSYLVANAPALDVETLLERVLREAAL